MKQLSLFLVCVTAAGLAITFMPSGLLSGQTLQPDSCHFTTPNGIVAGSSERNENSYGNALLSVGDKSGLSMIGPCQLVNIQADVIRRLHACVGWVRSNRP